MSNTHIIQTVIEVIAVALALVVVFYEPSIAKWEDKQKEKVLRAFKERRKFRGDNPNV